MSEFLQTILERPRLASGIWFAVVAFLVVLPFEILGVAIAFEAVYSSVRYPGYSSVLDITLILIFLQLTVMPGILGFIFGYFLGDRILESPSPSTGHVLGRGAVIAVGSMVIWLVAGILILGSITF